MIYLMLFYEFFLIGLFAIGGGAATVPFLFDLSSNHGWFTPQELTNIIAISESTPGPIGVNMATFAGYKTASYLGAISATLGLIMPSLIIIIFISKILKHYAKNEKTTTFLQYLQPAVVVLILNAAIQIATVSLHDALSLAVFAFIFIFMYFYKASPIYYMILSGVLGFTLNL